jgi:hypothetical protein
MSFEYLLSFRCVLFHKIVYSATCENITEDKDVTFEITSCKKDEVCSVEGILHPEKSIYYIDFPKWTLLFEAMKNLLEATYQVSKHSTVHQPYKLVASINHFPNKVDLMVNTSIAEKRWREEGVLPCEQQLNAFLATIIGQKIAFVDHGKEFILNHPPDCIGKSVSLPRLSIGNVAVLTDNINWID